MYYLYHIPGKKIGVTRNLINRVTKQQGYGPGEYEVLFATEDITDISLKEIKFQKQYGYKVDRQLYKDLIKSNQKSNRMKLNVTEQTTTFPIPLNKLKDRLEDAVGLKWETPFGSFEITKENYRELFKNCYSSMFNDRRSFVYNKILEKLANPENKTKKAKPAKQKSIFKLIRKWAKTRGLYEKGNPTTQYVKLQEEAGELAKALLKNDEPEIIDAIGDMVVVLTNLAHLKGYRIEDCINAAYNQISERKGKMINGTFVKEENTKKPWSHQSITL